MKKCNTCELEKDLTEFSKNQYACKSCNKQYRLDNIERVRENKKRSKAKCKERNKEYHKEYDRQYQIRNQEKLKEYRLKNKEKQREYYKEYCLKNREKIYKKGTKNLVTYKKYRKDYMKQRRKEDPMFRLSSNVRCLIRTRLKAKGYSKNSKAHEILGCDYEIFKLHLEKQFVKGMNWDNYGEWHLDHIYPTSLAKDEKHLLELNHYTNFQPLWALDNLSKGNRIKEKQLFLL